MQTFDKPTQDELMRMAIDIANPHFQVEVSFTEEEDKLWINIDGVCVLRIQNMSPGVLKLPTNGNGG